MGWTPRDAAKLLHGRTQSHTRTPAKWHVRGTLTTVATGRHLADIDGIQEVLLDSALHRTPPKKDAATSEKIDAVRFSWGDKRETTMETEYEGAFVVRDTLFYTENGKRMEAFRLRPTVRPRAVDAVLSLATRIRMGVTKSGALQLTRRKAGAEIHTRISATPLRIDGVLHTGWMYTGRSVRNAKGGTSPAVVERFDMSVGRGGAVWKWTGVGRCPHWYGGGLCVTQLTGVRDGDVGKVQRWMREIGRGGLGVGEVDRVEREAREERERERLRVEKRRRRFFGIL